MKGTVRVYEQEQYVECPYCKCVTYVEDGHAECTCCGYTWRVD